MNQDIRWQQRFENFERALQLLRDGVKNVGSLSELEQQGVIQRFEFTLELAWNTLKDYLIFSGVSLDQVTPKSVVKKAFAAKLIADGQLWVDMLDYRNRLSHTYDEAVFSEAVAQIADRFMHAFEELDAFLKKENSQ